MTNWNPLPSENKSLPLFPTAYFPPIAYLVFAKRFEEIAIEGCENYVKQSIRNRAYILSANGVLQLNVPVKRSGGEKMPISEMETEDKTPWQRNHLRAIRSAYGKTPYFDYYYPDLESMLLKSPKRLIELNNMLCEYVFRKIGIKTRLVQTTTYAPQSEIDMRNSFTKQNLFTDYRNKTYFQAFNNKFPFVENLSCLDLLFNMGTEAVQYLDFV